VDESCLGDGRAGAGGLIRRGDGSWVTGFNDFIGIGNNTYAELLKKALILLLSRLTSIIVILLSLFVFRSY